MDVSDNKLFICNKYTGHRPRSMRKTLLSLHALKRWGEQDQLLHCNIDKIDDLYTGRGGISHSSALPADFFEVLVCRRFHFLPDPVEVDHFAELAVREGVLLSSTQRAARGFD